MKRIVALALALIAQAAFAQTPPEAATAETPLTLQNFAAPPFMEGPQLSPNGKWIATKLSVNGNQLLTMMPAFEDGGKPRFLRLDPEQSDVDWWRWVNDDWLLIGLSATIDFEAEKLRIARVIALSRETGDFNQLAWKNAGQNAADLIWTARDGTPRILLGVQNSIYSNFAEFWPEVREIDVSTGKSRVAVGRRANVMDFYADSTGTVRMGYGYDANSRTARLSYRSDAKSGFKTLDRAKLAKDEELAFPALFLPEPDKALTVDDAEGYDALYELDLSTLVRGKKLFGAQGYDIDGLVKTPVGDGLAGVAITDTRTRIAWIDPAMAETQADLEKAVGAGNAHIVSWDKAMAQLLVEVGGPDQAGAFYLYNRAAGGKMSRIAFASDDMKMRRLAPVTTIKYKSRDGIEMSAVLTLPKNRPAKALPLILLPHGGPQVRDSERWDWWVQFLAWRGYAVIQPNYRGSTGYGTAFFEKGYGEWGLKMQDDLNDAVSHLTKEGVADPKRVCIVGGSYGGYAAMRGAQRDGNLFRCAVSYAGVSDMGALARYDRRFLYGREFKSTLARKAPDFAAVSPINFPDQFSTPILLLHGKLDLTVPVKQSRDLAEKLKAAGKDYRYVEQPKGDHHFSREADRLQFLQEMDAFLHRHNPA